MDHTSEQTDADTTRRGLLRMGGLAGLTFAGLSGVASADDSKDKKKRPPGHTDKSEGKRGNSKPGKKGKGKKKGHKKKKKRGKGKKKKRGKGKKKRGKGKKKY